MLCMTLVETNHSHDDFAKVVGEGVATTDAEDGNACSTQADFARETVHEEDNVRSETSTLPAFVSTKHNISRSSWKRLHRAK